MKKSKLVSSSDELMSLLGDTKLGTIKYYTCPTEEDIRSLLSSLYKKGFEHLATGKNAKESALIIWKRYKKNNVIQVKEFSLKKFNQHFKLVFFANMDYYVNKCGIPKSKIEKYYKD